MSKARKEKLVFALLALSALVVVIPVAAILYFLVSRGASAVTWSFLTEMPRHAMRQGGILSAIVGSACLMVGTLIFAVPVGVCAAIYLTEYAGQNMFTRLVRLAIVNLAGVPSIVYGLFGLGLFVLLLHFGRCILAGSLTLALMVLPVVITASEEALLTVPKSFRDASLGLGATKWQTIWRIVLPNSAAGILTGVILGTGRAIGETAPIMFTAAVFYMPKLPKSAFDGCMALPYQLYVMATEMFNAPEKAQWGTAVVLLMLVLGMSLVAAVIRNRFRRRRAW